METKTIWIDGQPYVKASELPEEGIPEGYGVIMDEGDRFENMLRETEEERPSDDRDIRMSKERDVAESNDDVKPFPKPRSSLISDLRELPGAADNEYTS